MYERRNEEEFQRRISLITVIVAFSFVLIVSRLWYLQLVHGKKFKSLSENNRIRIQKIAAPRGIIYDRKGKILVDNYPSFHLSFLPEDAIDLKGVLWRLSELLDLDDSFFNETLENVKDYDSFKEITLKTDLSRREVAIVETNKLDLPGVNIQIQPKRFYLHKNTASHIVGHMGKISKSQLKNTAYDKYGITDLIGKCGIEWEYESFLKGRDGGCQVEVDASGRELRILGELIEPIPGKNVFLTIDLDIQRTVEGLLDGKKACAIAMDPNNGEILALASSPSFNPNMFSMGISKTEWEELINNPYHPLENKAIQGQYPPGSIYKVITAIAALEDGIISPDTTFSCNGFYRFGGRNYRCWKKNGHGEVDLHKAIVESCDVFFYQVGKKLGIDRLSYYSFLLGLGKSTGISLSNEKPGLVPTREWKQKTLNSRWHEGETLSASIGQGFVLVTPIQILNLYSFIANNGTFYLPRIVKKINSFDGKEIKEYHSVRIQTHLFKEENINLIRDYLFGAVNEKDGTGVMSKSEIISIAGKTGTAQVVGLGDNSKEQNKKDIPFNLRDHAWFVAFAPLDSPKISVVVIIEHGGHGGVEAAPIAKEIIEKSLLYLAENEV